MLRLIRTVAVAAALGSASLLGACMNATPYQSATAADNEFGYQSEQLAPDRFRISFSGNSVTSRDRVENYLLYRAAELTRQNGYDGFTVVRQSTDEDIDVEMVPTSTTYPGFGVGYNYYGAGYGWTSYDPYLGTPYPAQRLSTSDRYQAYATIEMYRGAAPATATQAFDASDVLARLGDTIEEPEAG